MATQTPTLGGANNAKKGTTLGTSLTLPALKTPASSAAPPALSGAAPLTMTPISMAAKPPTTTTPASTAAPTPGTGLSAVKPAVPNQLTFSQLEDSINKWTADLAESEEMFLARATQINAWDKAINENEQRLVSLNHSVKQVQDQQSRINDDLHFISTQLTDLEQCIAPLEKDGDSYVTVKSEPQRKELYLTSIRIDSLMKRFSEDMKEVIEQINEASRAIDSSDPVLQIGRVLNAHTDSLHTIDEMAARIFELLETLSKTHNRLKKDTDIQPHHE